MKKGVEHISVNTVKATFEISKYLRNIQHK